MNQIFWIALGGAMGAVLRYLLGSGINTLLPLDFPLGTLLVNVLGCFAIGAVFAALGSNQNFETTLRPFFVIGILGGFTTFSSYSMEIITLLQNKEAMKAFSYFFLSNALGFAAAWFGYKLFTA